MVLQVLDLVSPSGEPFYGDCPQTYTDLDVDATGRTTCTVIPQGTRERRRATTKRASRIVFFETDGGGICWVLGLQLTSRMPSAPDTCCGRRVPPTEIIRSERDGSGGSDSFCILPPHNRPPSKIPSQKKNINQQFFFDTSVLIVGISIFFNHTTQTHP
jgi:hypothetical protein